MATTYDADQIQVLEGLEAVRKRPGCILVRQDQRTASPSIRGGGQFH